MMLLQAHKSLAQTQRLWSLGKGSVGLGIGSGIGLGTGLFLEHKVKPLSETQIIGLNPKKINAFDRIATRYWNKQIALSSDVLVGGLLLLPAALYALPNVRQQGADPALLLLQAYSLNYALNGLIKPLVRRTRPYNYNAKAPIQRKLDRDARLSFYSAHTSGAAVACFTAAKIFHHTHPDSRLRPYVWTSAAIAPALVGYMRVRAGKHFPTDVLTGYVIGGLVGILVPELHKSRR